MTITPYDFRRPNRSRGSVEQPLADWLQTACRIAERRWSAYVPFKVDVSVQGVERVSPDEALARLPEACVGYRISVNNDKPASLLVRPRPLVLALVAGALGEVVDVVPVDREPTPVEFSLSEFLLQNVMLTVAQESWPASSPFHMALAEREPMPRFTRLFFHCDSVYFCSLEFAFPFATQAWHWILPPLSAWEQLTRNGPDPTGAAQNTGLLEENIRSLPVELRVDLGSVELSVAQVGQLAAGDVLILNQRVTDPLTTHVDGKEKFLGWPGRVGSRQGLKIACTIG